MTTSPLQRRSFTCAVTAMTTAALLASGGSLGASAATTAPGAGADWRASVGPGWVVDATSSSTSTQPGQRGPFTIAMVSPTGARHVVARTAQDIEITDVSPDGRRALALRTLPDSSTRVLELDLTTGTSHLVSTLPVRSATYTRPSAREVLLPDTDSVVRVSLDGRVLSRYPTGAFSTIASSGNGKRLVTVPVSPDGLPVTDSATGARVRTIPSPAGYGVCLPGGTWDATQVTVFCQKADDVVWDVQRVSTTTGAAHLLTHVTSGNPAEANGYAAAWKVGNKVLAQRLVSCGPGPIGLLDAAGHIGTELTWPAMWAAPLVEGVTGTSVVASSSSCFGDAPTTELAVQDAVTHRIVTLDSAAHLSAAVVAHQ